MRMTETGVPPIAVLETASAARIVDGVKIYGKDATAVRVGEPEALRPAADERADHPDAGDLLPQHLVDPVDLGLHRPELRHHQDQHDRVPESRRARMPARCLPSRRPGQGRQVHAGRTLATVPPGGPRLPS